MAFKVVKTLKKINLEHYPKTKKVLEVVIVFIAVCASPFVLYFILFYVPFHFFYNEEQQRQVIEFYHENKYLIHSAIFTLCLSFLWIAFISLLAYITSEDTNTTKSKTN